MEEVNDQLEKANQIIENLLKNYKIEEDKTVKLNEKSLKKAKIDFRNILVSTKIRNRTSYEDIEPLIIDVFNNNYIIYGINKYIREKYYEVQSAICDVIDDFIDQIYYIKSYEELMFFKYYWEHYLEGECQKFIQYLVTLLLIYYFDINKKINSKQFHEVSELINEFNEKNRPTSLENAIEMFHNVTTKDTKISTYHKIKIVKLIKRKKIKPNYSK